MTSKCTNYLQTNQINFVNQITKKIPFNKFAVLSGFKKRKEKKITGKTLLLSFFLMSLQGNNSFAIWASHLNNLTKVTVSKQGIWKRITPFITNFLILILSNTLSTQIYSTHENIKRGNLKIGNYLRILIQDSTTIALPDWLLSWFPGNTSKGKRKSQLKIQVVYDLIANSFVSFEITPYTVNDQAKSSDILKVVKKGDLVIRDLGYFKIENFEQMNKTDNVSFVSRIKYGVKIFDIKSGEEINLLKHLRKHKRFDNWVELGVQNKVKVRLVIVPLNEEQANAKKHKAKFDRNKRVNHNKEYYELLGYSLYITNELITNYSSKKVTQIYGLRWRIENIFKCWKSQFHLQKIIPKNCSLTKDRVESIIYMMLIFVLLFKVTIYNYMVIESEKLKNHTLSLTKLSQFISNNITKFFSQNLEELTPEILYYCSYEKRNDRQNFVQKLNLS